MSARAGWPRLFLSTAAGLLLVPLLAAMGWTLWDLLLLIAGEGHSGWSRGTYWMLGGFLLWLALWFSMPPPMLSYVLGHELTHALWALVFGTGVHSMKVTSTGGYVELSRTNFFITLAPYFFPFYTFLAMVLRFVIGLVWNQAPYEPFWLGLVGLTWGFHLTFTINMLGDHQPDIRRYGRSFSYLFIIFMNIVGICIWLVAVARPTSEDFFRLASSNLEAVAEFSAGLLALAAAKFRSSAFF